MSNDINLLSHQKRGRFSQEQVLAFSKVAAIACSILTVTLAIVLFLLNRDPALAQLHAQEDTILAQLNLVHNKTAKNLIILDRVKRIAKINQTRTSLEKKIEVIQKQLPAGVLISSFTLDNKHLSITISSQSLSQVGGFIESLTKDAENNVLLKKLTLQGVVSDEKTGSYLLSITGDLL